MCRVTFGAGYLTLCIDVAFRKRHIDDCLRLRCDRFACARELVASAARKKSSSEVKDLTRTCQLAAIFLWTRVCNVVCASGGTAWSPPTGLVWQTSLVVAEQVWDR
jgi:hypothetical protein